MTSKALAGVRVVELGPYVALPLTGRILASLGDRDHQGRDPTRSWTKWLSSRRGLEAPDNPTTND